MTVIHAALAALVMAAEMGWLLLWPLILGFAISGAIQAVVSHSEMAKLLPDDRPGSILRAAALGAASSSCSYAAVAIARSMIRKGADFRAAMAFQFASTNLVIELGIILAVILGWRFTAATWAGGVAMIVILTLLLRPFLRPKLVEAAKRQAEKGLAGRMEGHAEMDMSVGNGPLLKRFASAEGFTAISRYFVMDWASVWVDLVGGLLIAGALAAWVPNTVWSSVFFTHDPAATKIVGPLLGPLIAVASFVCSVGNVPLAAVLWNGGASFGGVIAFPPLLWLEGRGAAVCLVLRSHGARRLYRGIRVRRGRSGPAAALGADRRTGLRLELHNLPEPRLPRVGRGPYLALPENRRLGDVTSHGACRRSSSRRKSHDRWP